MARIVACALLAATTTLTACGARDTGGPAPVLTPEALALLETLRYDASEPPPDPSNRVADDAQARVLGRRLFFDPSLSGPLIDSDNDGSSATLGVMGEPMRVSCAGCHVPESRFVDTRSNHRQISLGAQWTSRRAQTLLEIAFAPLYNWDGRRDSLWGQALGVIESEREMNSGRLFVAQQMFARHRAEYEALFGPMPDLSDTARFPYIAPEDAGCWPRRTLEGTVLDCHGRPGDGAEYDGLSEQDKALVTEVLVNTGKAMAAYVRELRCGPSRFDAWLDGDASALSRSELRGALLFVGEAGCVSCHSGPRLTDGAFHNVGLAPATVAVAFTDLHDRGAGEALPLLAADPMNMHGVHSDGVRDVPLPTPGPSLEGAFRTPTLRCIGTQPSFMHTGQLRTIEQVVAFFDRGGDRQGFEGTSEIHALHLDERERADLAAFLRALDGPGPAEALLSPPP